MTRLSLVGCSYHVTIGVTVQVSHINLNDFLLPGVMNRKQDSYFLVTLLVCESIRYLTQLQYVVQQFL
jgi:hypothetical protein